MSLLPMSKVAAVACGWAASKAATLRLVAADTCMLSRPQLCQNTII
jgi:hypothetical protein